MFSLEEIEKLNEKYIPIAIQKNREHWEKIHGKWQRENRSVFKLSQIKYRHSEKGRNAERRKSGNYLKRLWDQMPEMNDQERAMMFEFYMQCPKGFDVDHIIPISKGGKHSLENLQWLEAIKNKIKKDKIITDTSLPPYCPVNFNFKESLKIKV